MEFIAPYKITVLVLGLTALVFFLQTLIADVIGISVKHKPGHPVPVDHANILFRATRAAANSNETVAIFMLAIGFAILSAADPQWLNLSALVYLVGRIGHMVFYYANLKLLRSISFAVSFVGIASALVSGFLVWL